MAATLASGEDGLYSFITEDKNVIFAPKKSITTRDLAEIPYLVSLREAITAWEKRLPHTSGRNAYITKQTIIDLKKDQYIIKDFFKRPIRL